MRVGPQRYGIPAASLAMMLAAGTVRGAEYYVATDGDDASPGTEVRPFASIMRAHDAASAGDVVYIRGDTYTKFTVAATDATYQYVIRVSKDGIRFVGKPGDARPVLDFSGVSPEQLRVCGILVTGSRNTFEDIELTGIHAGKQKQCDNWRISGSGNTLRRIVNRDDQANGVYLLGRASDTLVENCDSYNLVGVQGTSAGNTDGFGCHSAGSGNVFRGCRAWGNSDDGFDCINNSGGGVTFDHCWAYDNGRAGGDMNGFKVGGFGNRGGRFPDPPPVHTVRFCVSAGNGANGFYANHQPGQSANWLNNTAYNNRGANFNMLEAVDTSPEKSSVPGTREVLHNNLAFGGKGIANLDQTGEMVSHNSFNLPVTVDADDFKSMDATELTRPRKADGSLPDVRFMHLKAASDPIDAGVDVGLPFKGKAPDLGAFEAGASVKTR